MAKRLMLSIATAALVAACMSQADTAAVEAAVAQFHALQSRGDDAAIYAAASAEFRQNASAEDLARIDTAVRNVRSCAAPARDPNAWNSNVNTSGHFVTVVYNRQCADGPLTETFVFRVNNNEALLMGYNAAGMALFPPAPANPATTTREQSTTPTTTPTTSPAAPAKPSSAG